jgi:hypothetical protein
MSNVIISREREESMLSWENWFYRLCALRIARGLNGSETTQGAYRSLVRQYAQELGDPALGEKPDEVVFGPIVLLWEESCLELTKFSLRTSQNHDFSEFGPNWNGLWKFLSVNGFRMKLKPKGREMLNEMEAEIAASRPVEHKKIGF